MDTVLITGTTSGIGKAFAEKFAKAGNNIILVSRNESKLQQQQVDLQSRYHVSVKYISCNLAEDNAPNMIMEKIGNMGLSVDILINNAGFNEAGYFIDTSLEKELDMIQVHIKILTALTKRILPGMIERRYGRILNVGSTGSYMPCPCDAVYAATKSYVLSFSNGLYQELKGTGVTVTCLCPGATNTLFATITKAPKVQEIAVLFSGSYLSYNGRETGLTVPCLSFHARPCKLSAGPLIAAFDLRRLKHRSASVYSCNKAS